MRYSSNTITTKIFVSLCLCWILHVYWPMKYKNSRSHICMGIKFYCYVHVQFQGFYLGSEDNSKCFFSFFTPPTVSLHTQCKIELDNSLGDYNREMIKCTNANSNLEYQGLHLDLISRYLSFRWWYHVLIHFRID